MKRAIRIALGFVALAAGLAVAGASPASAQVRFEGSFPLPNGRISVGVGDPVFSVGTYVPYGYSVYQDPQYGYGFYYGDQWIPCEQRGSRWIIAGRRGFNDRRGSGYARPDRNYRYGYSRQYRGSVRSYRNYEYGYSQPYRRGFDSRRGGRENRFRDHDGGWSR